MVTARDSGRAVIKATVAGKSDTVVITVVADEPPPAPPSSPGDSFAVLVGAGDIAKCNAANRAMATARLLDSIPGTVFTLGDNAYDDGTSAEFADCYDPAWGRHKARTRPALGNHEYNTSPDPYFDYFDGVGHDSGAAGERGAGYYSYDLATWHIIVLNSEIAADSMSPQAAWLRGDLAAHVTRCALAYWHRPFFASGPHRSFTPMRPLIAMLYAAGVDVILSGHNHQYERFGPQDPAMHPDTSAGMRAFVVGTGGAGVYDIWTPQPNSEVRNGSVHGVLKLSLAHTRYPWHFVPIAGETFSDSGTGDCH
jgi:hypothetical protein